MTKNPKTRHKILIADDSEMNRAILADMLGDEYDITEVENGAEAVTILQQRGSEYSLLLLDLVMPVLDGFGVLKAMNQARWIDDIPVIMISAESGASNVEQAYKLGVTDFISRPFDAMIVHKRVINTIMLHAKQQKLVGLVLEQIYEKEQQSSMMIEILSHIVEFRNGESGLHVMHIRVLTELFLEYLTQNTDQYSFSRAEISLISTASALHDIGKIAIPSEVLNKPGKLTDEEFKIMKTHSAVGASMLEDLPVHKDEPLVKTAYEICRWHHERYDGRGYPDGLKGEEIPMSAQIVALADVYDALTSERAYKKAFSHETAIEMILGGQCGTFNPLLMDCLREMADQLPEMLKEHNQTKADRHQIQDIEAEIMQHDELSPSARAMHLVEHERMKYNFFAAMSEEIQFEYKVSPSMVTLSSWGAEKIGLPEIVMDPHHDERVRAMTSDEDRKKLAEAIKGTTPEEPVTRYDCKLNMNGTYRWVRFICRTTWSEDDPPQYLGAIGKAIDIQEERNQIKTLERLAAYDEVTGLLNRTYAQKRIEDYMVIHSKQHYALAIIDVNAFNIANEKRGHIFGDRILAYVAGRLKQAIREEDIVARAGGDEFLLFMESREDSERTIQRISETLTGEFEDFSVSVNIGIALTRTVGKNYNALLQGADRALYTAKQMGEGTCCFFQESLQENPSELSPIKGTSKEQENCQA